MIDMLGLASCTHIIIILYILETLDLHLKKYINIEQLFC